VSGHSGPEDDSGPDDRAEHPAHEAENQPGAGWTAKPTATITRATALERLWTRLTGDFEFMELCEFSFSEEATL
jgi:hypothetical protein